MKYNDVSYCVCIGDTDIMLLSKFVLTGNKNDQIETLTLYVEWSQFVVDYFF